MNLRWLLGNFTHPDFELTRAEQREVSTIAHERFTPPGAFWRWTALIVLPALVAIRLLSVVLDAMGYAGDTRAYTIGLAVILVLFWPWSAWMYRFIYVRPIRRAMRVKGYDLCVGCGYDLRGQAADVDRCPECGRTRAEDPRE